MVRFSFFYKSATFSINVANTICVRKSTFCYCVPLGGFSDRTLRGGSDTQPKIPPIFTDRRGSVILNIKKKKIYFLRVENGCKDTKKQRTPTKTNQVFLSGCVSILSLKKSLAAIVPTSPSKTNCEEKLGARSARTAGGAWWRLVGGGWWHILRGFGLLTLGVPHTGLRLRPRHRTADPAR